jgi:perosamine synthetase
VAAAVAIPQMEHLDEIIRTRQDNAAVLTSLLHTNPAVTTPVVPAGRRHVWHQYTVLFGRGIDRDRVAMSMSSDGIDTGVYYPGLVWDHDAYRNHAGVHRDDTPVARDCTSRCLSLPVHPGLLRDDLQRVAESLERALLAS